MKVSKLIKELERCKQDENVTMCIEAVDGHMNFYHIEFVSLSGEKNFPVMLNGSCHKMDSGRR